MGLTLSLYKGWIASSILIPLYTAGIAFLCIQVGSPYFSLYKRDRFFLLCLRQWLPPSLCIRVGLPERLLYASVSAFGYFRLSSASLLLSAVVGPLRCVLALLFVMMLCQVDSVDCESSSGSSFSRDISSDCSFFLPNSILVISRERCRMSIRS